MMKVNLIYNGDGVSQQFLPFLIKTFQMLGKTKLISSSELIEGKWIDHATSLIMPGGRDRPYHRDLKGVGNQHIQTFVKKGGLYIGICAGAYYGSSYVEFAKGSDLEVLEKRELGFFQGKAVGPILGTEFDYNEKGIEHAKIIYRGNICLEGQLYYHGGPTFIGKGDYKTLATYFDNKSPAMVLSQFGNGKIFLSGAHFEYPNKDPLLEKVRQKIVLDLLDILSNRS